jgi:SAM-dependent methyltransferase
MGINIDTKTVAGFGDEWDRFTQKKLDEKEKEQIFQDYFDIFPWHVLPKDGGQGADIGCGSGRWATLVAPKVKKLHLIDASERALQVARRNLEGFKNTEFYCCDLNNIAIKNGTLDFIYSLGVLHHVPDTQRAIISIVEKLKPGAPFLIYLYYSFDNRPLWYRCIWKISDLVRFPVSRCPYFLRYFISQIAAGSIYWPLARMAKLLEFFKILPTSWPLAYYRKTSFYTMRTDALDRFGTRLERRFTKSQIRKMLESAGLLDVKFSESNPFWCAVGIKSTKK